MAEQGKRATNYRQLKVKSILRKEYVMADVSTCVRTNTIDCMGAIPIDHFRNNAKFLCENYDCTAVSQDVYRHSLTCGVDVVKQPDGRVVMTLGTRYVQYANKDSGKKLTLLYPLFPENERQTEKLLQRRNGSVNALPVYYRLSSNTYIVRIQIEQNVRTKQVLKASLTVHTSKAEGTDVYVDRIGLTDGMTNQMLSSLYAQIVKRGIFQV